MLERQFEMDNGREMLHTDNVEPTPITLIMQMDGARVKNLPQSWGTSMTVISMRPDGMKQPFIQLHNPTPLVFLLFILKYLSGRRSGVSCWR